MNNRMKMSMTAGALCIAALLVGFLSYHGSTFTVSVSNAEAQRRIDAALAKRASEGKAVRIESATVTFADDHIVIDSHIEGHLRSRKVRADVHAEGMPEYRGGAFYFHPTALPLFTNVKVEHAPSAFFPKTRELFKRKLETEMEKHGWEDLATTFETEFKTWAEAKAEKALTAALTRHPVYVLPDTAKGFAIRAVLEKVEVVNGELHITLSLVQLAYSIFIAAVCLVLAVGLVIFLAMNPEWGLLLAVLP